MTFYTESLLFTQVPLNTQSRFKAVDDQIFSNHKASGVKTHGLECLF